MGRIKFQTNSTHKFLSIGFLGPDGSGKSTIINKIIPLFDKSYYFHLKPLPAKENGSATVDPHKHPSYSKLLSYIKLFYFLLQYNWGWFKHIRPIKAEGNLIIFDRYFDDILVDNRRYRYGGSIRVAKLLRKFIPRPNLYFILTADAKVIYRRKKEVVPEELERQLKSYKALADESRYYNIDVDREPDEILKEITSIIEKNSNAF